MDWPALLRLGVHHLRLEPERFWRLSPIELRLMLGGGGADAPMGRDQLDALCRAFPDVSKDMTHG